jgi:hypothetical protein
MGRSDDYIPTTISATVCVGASVRLTGTQSDKWLGFVAVPSRFGTTVCASLFIGDPQNAKRIRLGSEPISMRVACATLVVKNCTATNTVSLTAYK